LLHEDVQDGVVEGRVGGMPVRFPTAIGQVEFNSPAERLAIVDLDNGVGKVGTSFAVPGAELNDFDLISGDRSKVPAEIAREPAGLQF
jgi:hypothetical protein